MAPPSTETINIVQRVIDNLAGNDLPRTLARLYSHHTRLRENRPGLPSWGRQETLERLHDVMRLVEAASVQREASEANDEWQRPMRRAGELLEWLSSNGSEVEGVPVRFLSAAAYQIAGYPARAAGLLNADDESSSQSQILKAFLRADFPLMFSGIANFWEEELRRDEWRNEGVEFSDALSQIVVNETISALGMLCNYMRWGNDDRLERATSKLSAVKDVLLHSHNPYSWLLGKLCGEVAQGYSSSTLRRYLQVLLPEHNETGRQILERYYRIKYQSKQALAWPSQIMGIAQLAQNRSFALCTPTGSGKTTVAELAILQGLFVGASEGEVAPLVIYIVPSRALATEVEAKLSKVLKNVSPQPQEITVTGLYGGTDWGPTDAWANNNSRTVLICTFEKAEALVKFLGTSFLQRVSLVVIDEAHGVQLSESHQKLQKSESRALRLESLTSRLFAHLRQEGRNGRVIALSAVAAGVEQAISQWATQGIESNPVSTPYRSTRQLIGRLECLEGRGFEIQYDVLDGARLEIQGMRPAEQPYIPNPFPPYPPALRKFEGANTSGLRLRPFLFWAAMHLAAPDEQGHRRAVLISITQGISGYADAFLKLLQSRVWRGAQPPEFFTPPLEPEESRLWQRCLDSCADYFTTDSREYQLLQRGIVIHHGNMPGLLARLLVEAISAKIVTLVMATSTLSEGVNLPFETVLIPKLERFDDSLGHLRPLESKEFSNLVGRAGRPGFGTEGRSLVLLLNSSEFESARTARQYYQSLLTQLVDRQDLHQPQSPLAQLIHLLVRQWQQLAGENDPAAFTNWLEQAEPCNSEPSNDLERDTIESLDSLDNILLTAIYEIEQMAAEDVSPEQMEIQLRQIWQNTYARYADTAQNALEDVYIRRGQALRARVYPELNRRRRLYRTSLPPRSGNRLLETVPNIRQHLLSGIAYASWEDEEKFAFVRTSISLLGEIPIFALEARESSSWTEQLRWWLFHSRSFVRPTDTTVAKWQKDINSNFIYKFNWGFGSVVSLAIDEAFGGQVLEPRLEDWPLTELPWVVFWMKEIIMWGTLEPVAAFLLARVDAVTTRAEAEIRAVQYNAEVANEEPNERLNAVRIRDWVQREFPQQSRNENRARPPMQIRVSRLLRDFDRFPSRHWQVIPVEDGDGITWIDPAGFPLATSSRPEHWENDFLNRWDFKLNPEGNVVLTTRYL